MLPIRPRCEFFPRFGSGYAGMDESQYWQTYHRSQKKRPTAKQNGKTNEPTAFSPQPGQNSNQSDKKGTYFNPFCYSVHAKTIQPQNAPQPDQIVQISRYDAFLAYQHQMAAYIVDKVLETGIKVKLNADNQYPGVLVFIEPPAMVKNIGVKAAWCEFVILLINALADYLSIQCGIPINLSRRSSFSHLRPTICETNPSIRISPGCIPKHYADILVYAIFYSTQLTTELGHKVFDTSLQRAGLIKTINAYNQQKELTGSEALNAKQILWNALWNRFDSSGKCFMAQVLRNQYNPEWLINQYLDALLAYDGEVEDLFYKKDRFHPDIKQLKAIFQKPWDTILDGFILHGESISLRVGDEPLKTYGFDTLISFEDDQDFLQAMQLFSADAENLVKNPPKEGLHTVLEREIVSQHQRPFNFKVEDGCGSDSDEEETIQGVSVYANKRITATGMRAIQLAFGAIRLYCNQTYHANFSKMQFRTDGMYYETKEALSKHALTISGKKGVNERADRYIVSLYDLNHCNTTQTQTTSLKDAIKGCFKMVIIDITSTDQKTIAATCQQLLLLDNKITSIIFVSSFKNEQAGIDLNPYGTIRIFSKDKKERDGLYQAIDALEKEAQYKHPATSHLLRKHNKQMGWMPTNRGIISFFKQGQVVGNVKENNSSLSSPKRSTTSSAV